MDNCVSVKNSGNIFLNREFHFWEY